MSTPRVFLLLILCLSGLQAIATAQSNPRTEKIKQRCQKIDADVARSEQEPEYSNIYLTELAVNKGNGSYPAVGIYRPVVKFFYTYGDREKNPYPNRLFKIVVAIDRSDRKEYAEYCFNEAEQMVFYLEKKDDIERRVYFVSERPIAFLQDNKPLSLRSKSQAATVASVLKEKASLVSIFKRSLEFE
ncbi:MAG TPA: hypothetical protein VJT71_03820 [Pyrinomonadaceae bacterium]|nr:hypothetical protein [Pyrinomonadaceae bacterium]